MTEHLDEDLLVRYWARDLSDADVDAVEAHVFDCMFCYTASARIAATTAALTQALPPIALPADIERASARGLVHATNEFSPDVPTEAWLHRGTDFLVHRLLGDLSDVEKVSVELALPGGPTILTFPDARFDGSAGAVLIACQRHFVERFPPNVEAVVRRTHRDGHESTSRYVLLHRVAENRPDAV